MKLEGKSLGRDFLKFIIPSIVAQWVFTLYTIVDGLFVARGVSELAVTAVNIAMPYVNALFSLSILFAVGNSTIVAIKLGAGEKKSASEVFTQNLVFLAAVSLIITLFVLLNLGTVADFLGATAATKDFVCKYIATIAPFSIAFVLSYSFEMLIKTDGFPGKAMVIVITGAVLNCVLDWLMVIVLDWGVFGAAFATGFSQAFVCVLYMMHFISKKSNLSFVKFKWQTSLLLREARNGFSSGLVELSSGFYIFLFNKTIVACLNEDALVSFTIIAYVNSLVVMSMAGISQGSQPLVSYYYGKMETDKCKKLLRMGNIAALVLSAAFVLVFLLGTDWIVGMFIEDASLVALKAYSAKAFRIFCASYLLVGFNVVIGGYFTSMEKAGSAIIIAMARGFVVITLSVVGMALLTGGEGIWWAPTVSEAVVLAISVALLSLDKKKQRKKAFAE